MKNFITILLLTCPILANAQFYTGLKAGLNLSNQFYYSTSTYTNYSYQTQKRFSINNLGSFKPNFNIAGIGGYSFSSHFSMQTELLYLSMGYIDKTYSDNSMEINYLQWNPIVLKFLLGPSRMVQFFGSTGFGVAFPLRANFKAPDTTEPHPDDPFTVYSYDQISLKEYVLSPNVSLFIGAGLSIPAGRRGKIEVETRYQGSCSFVYEDSFSKFLADADIFNSNWMLQVGYNLYFRN